MKVFLSATSLKRAYGGPAVSVLRLGEALYGIGVEIGLWAADGSRPPDGQTKLSLLEGSLEHALNLFGRPDIIHDNGLWLAHNHRLALTAHRFGWPRCVSPRGMLERWAFGHKRAKKWIAWALYQRRDLNQAVGLHATSVLEAAGLDRFKLRPTIDVVPNGVDLVDGVEIEAAWQNRMSASRSPGRHAVFIGRLHPVKNLERFLYAWASTAPRGWSLTLAGPDENGERSRLEARAVQLGLGDVTKFQGIVGFAQRRALLLGADIFVLPSLQESFGIAVAEALAHGLPVITTTGAPWAQLPERRAGWRVEPTTEALAAALQEATRLSDAERREMGYAAHALIDAEFSWQYVANRFLATYGKLR